MKGKKTKERKTTLDLHNTIKSRIEIDDQAGILRNIVATIN